MISQSLKSGKAISPFLSDQVTNDIESAYQDNVVIAIKSHLIED